MTPELTYLALSVILFFAMILAQSLAALTAKDASISELVGPRDFVPPGGLSAFHGRTKRAQANMVEGMCMFVPAVLVAVLVQQTSGLTALGAALFFWSRVVFAVTYWFGVPWVRTFAWFGSIFGIALILWEIFL